MYLPYSISKNWHNILLVKYIVHCVHCTQITNNLVGKLLEELQWNVILPVYIFLHVYIMDLLGVDSDFGTEIQKCYLGFYNIWFFCRHWMVGTLFWFLKLPCTEISYWSNYSFLSWSYWSKVYLSHQRLTVYLRPLKNKNVIKIVYGTYSKSILETWFFLLFCPKYLACTFYAELL